SESRRRQERKAHVRPLRQKQLTVLSNTKGRQHLKTRPAFSCAQNLRPPYHGPHGGQSSFCAILPALRDARRRTNCGIRHAVFSGFNVACQFLLEPWVRVDRDHKIVPTEKLLHFPTLAQCPARI